VEEARRVLARLERIERLERDLLEELRALAPEALTWARAERSDAAAAAAARLAERLGPPSGGGEGTE
jgi:hypothetical protein